MSRAAMIDRLVIHFTGPICRCEKEMLITTIMTEDQTFVVSCSRCATRVVVPFTDVPVYHKVDQPYPDSKQAPAAPDGLLAKLMALTQQLHESSKEALVLLDSLMEKE
jgi:hypothetical protein